MSSDVSSLRDTIVPKSDQLNSEQLLSGPITITVTAVKRGSDEQPVIVHYQGDDGRPFKPCKSMRKVLIFAWGDDGREWVGKSMTLFCNPDVKFGGVKVGGIRISHLSHVERDMALSLTATKGRKEEHIIRKLDTPRAVPAVDYMAAIRDAVDLDTLKSAYASALKAAKVAGHQFTSEQYATAKDMRKAVLSAPAVMDAPPVMDVEELPAADDGAPMDLY